MALKYRLKKRSDLVYQPDEAPEAAAMEAVSVSELTRRLRLTLESEYAWVCVEGEISNFKFHSSGHMYFSLKDEEAQLSCVMFRRENSSIGFEMEDGLRVVCFGRVSIYPARGQYQLYVERVEPKGVGALQLRFEKLKEALKKEGLFEMARKKKIPFLPEKVAVVTSLDGAALRDVLQVLGRRHSTAHILIYPVAVQGKDAAPQIAEALFDLNANDAADVVILARGGGSLEDLWAFNEEKVARAISASRIPVISAVGHETDVTIADFVSDLRAPTPSAAAEMVMPKREDLMIRLEELKTRAGQSMSGLIESLRESADALVQSRALKDPFFYFQTKIQRLDELSKDAASALQRVVFLKRESVAHWAGKLEALGPLSTLNRGFSVALSVPGRRIISSVQDVQKGDTVHTRLKDGAFLSIVKEVRNGG